MDERRLSKIVSLNRVAWLALAAVIGSYLARHESLAFMMPTPWPDEGSFLWQAIAFAERNTLYAPELNPERHILWMPPGYMVFLGTIFKITGFSFEWARWLSALLVAASVLGLAMMLKPGAARLALVPIGALFLHSPIATLAGNTARMEPLVLFSAVFAFFLVQRNRLVGAAGLLTLLPIVHPNGVFLTASGLLLCIWEWRRERPRIVRWEWALAAASIVSWSSYAVYVAFHFDTFMLDIVTQLEWKDAQSALEGGLASRVIHPFVLVAIVLLSAAAWVLRAQSYSRALVFMAGALVVQMALTVGWLYEIYAMFGLTVVAVLTVEAGIDLAKSRPGFAGGRARWARPAIALLVTVLFAFFVFPHPYLARSVTAATVLRHPLSPKYVTRADIANVERFLLASSRKDRRLIVQFLPEADALLFAHLRSPTLGLLQQTRYDGKADMYIHHDSVWLTPYLRQTNALRVGLQQGVATPIPLWPVLQRRDFTEIWRVYRRPDTTVSNE